MLQTILNICMIKINLLVKFGEIIPLYYDNQSKPPVYSMRICQDITSKHKTVFLNLCETAAR
jgi:hypothetical protein